MKVGAFTQVYPRKICVTVCKLLRNPKFFSGLLYCTVRYLRTNSGTNQRWSIPGNSTGCWWESQGIPGIPEFLGFPNGNTKMVHIMLILPWSMTWQPGPTGRVCRDGEIRRLRFKNQDLKTVYGILYYVSHQAEGSRRGSQ